MPANLCIILPCASPPTSLVLLMRLKKLRVAGFKSFVDPTDIRLPASLVAVVGPNGCGKSNIIDAVRWVMGEASAKMLRGDNMTDVIFNGSTGRKPVGKATVELLFDNSAGKAGGSFARFAEISVKRTLSRDGNSNYFINQIKTRRKDVLDLFRGTGLGPRSYSVIEQGMVSRIIEARPEDLRLFVEEAAGTSKYKERRRETESRMARAQDDLQQVALIREQSAKQLRRLKRQASEANRYKTLREEHRLVQAQLLLLKVGALDDILQQQDRQAAEYQNQVEAALAKQRASETELEKLRTQQGESQQRHYQVQQESLGIAGEIKNIEQRIHHQRETKKRQEAELHRLREAQQTIAQQLEIDQSRYAQLQAEQRTLKPQAGKSAADQQQSAQRLAKAEAALENWRRAWEEFAEQAQAPAQQQEVQRARIAQLEQNAERVGERISVLQQQCADAENQRTQSESDLKDLRMRVAQHDQEYAQHEQEFQRGDAALQKLQYAIQAKRDESARLQSEQQQTQSRLTSLRQIQAAALGGEDQNWQDWLQQNRLARSAKMPKLAERLRVADGWQVAVDRVMRDFLGAVCVTKLPDLSKNDLRDRPDRAFTLIAENATTNSANSAPQNPAAGARLVDKVQASKTDLSAFLSGIYAAESTAEAFAKQSALKSHECIVTREGVLFGSNWVAFPSHSQVETGLLAREQEIKQLQKKLPPLTKQAHARTDEIAKLEKQIAAEQQDQQARRDALSQSRSQSADLYSDLAREEERVRDAVQRAQSLQSEIARLTKQSRGDARELASAQKLLRRADEQHSSIATKRDKLTAQKDKLQSEVQECKQHARTAEADAHTHALQQQRLDAELTATSDSIARGEEQLQHATAQLAQLKKQDAQSQNNAKASKGKSVGSTTATTADTADTESQLQAELQRLLERQVEAEQRASTSGKVDADLSTQIQVLTANRDAQIQEVQTARDVLHQHQVDKQETVVHRKNYAEQIKQAGFAPEDLREKLPPQANATEWEAKHEALERKTKRIGAVNLLAIEEFKEESQRKEYLDSQYADLSEALETLRNAIRKIDLETRTKFKDTFDMLNHGFQDFFPRLFGGGKVELQLTDDDLLTAGVVVMARPPGKRNSHIQLLSGGEKALTAVALLFALFKLNPAPFCMLDEVDAPLDDANVERYCQTLKSLTKASQMIVITHNKITMEAADILLGVTMGEPGVSRLVSVDVEQSAALLEDNRFATANAQGADAPTTHQPREEMV